VGKKEKQDPQQSVRKTGGGKGQTARVRTGLKAVPTTKGEGALKSLFWKRAGEKRPFRRSRFYLEQDKKNFGVS